MSRLFVSRPPSLLSPNSNRHEKQREVAEKTNSDMLVGAAEAFLVSHSQLNVINDRIYAAGRPFVPVAAILVPSAWPVESVRW